MYAANCCMCTLQVHLQCESQGGVPPAELEWRVEGSPVTDLQRISEQVRDGVQCTLYSVQCTVYSVNCTLKVYTVNCMTYTVPCRLTMSTMCTVHSPGDQAWGHRHLEDSVYLHLPGN